MMQYLGLQIAYQISDNSKAIYKIKAQQRLNIVEEVRVSWFLRIIANSSFSDASLLSFYGTSEQLILMI